MENRSLAGNRIRDTIGHSAAKSPETKRWPHEVRRAPAAVVRVDGTCYPRCAVFVDDDARRRALLDAMNAKYGFDFSLGTGRAWFFRFDVEAQARPHRAGEGMVDRGS